MREAERAAELIAVFGSELGAASAAAEAERMERWRQSPDPIDQLAALLGDLDGSDFLELVDAMLGPPPGCQLHTDQAQP